MLMMTKDGVGLMIFGGVRLMHGLGDGVAFLFMGMVGIGVAIWGISRVVRNESARS